MTETEMIPPAAPGATIDEIQKGWNDLTLRVGQLEVERTALEQENKILRQMVETVIEHRQKSHSELVMLLAGLVSKLQLNDVGVIVSRLVEHNTQTSQFLAALVKGTADPAMEQPVVLKTWDQAKRDLISAIKPVLDELIQADTPIETELIQSLAEHPDNFFAPAFIRANRCFIKGQVPRERIAREFGADALIYFNDMSTDPKLNPHPKPEEIVLAFKPDFEALFAANPSIPAQNREGLLKLYEKVQKSKAPTEQARAQKNTFQKLSFLIELLHYYENQNTEAPDVIFAQRLPALIEAMSSTRPNEPLDEKTILAAENLVAFVMNSDHRLMIINNLGKGSDEGKTLKFTLRLRPEKIPDAAHVVSEFVRHFSPPSPSKPPAPEAIAILLRPLAPEAKLLVISGIMTTDRLRREEAEKLGKAVAQALNLKLPERIKAAETMSAEMERQQAWGRIKDMITKRTEAPLVAAAFRERLNAKYDSDEIRQSWLTLIEADTISLIRVFCQLPYLDNGKTDPIARPVIETYVSRMTHEKYASSYAKVTNSLRSMFQAKPDSPLVVNFIALVRWVDPGAADRLSRDIGMVVAA